MTRANAIQMSKKWIIHHSIVAPRIWNFWFSMQWVAPIELKQFSNFLPEMLRMILQYAIIKIHLFFCFYYIWGLSYYFIDHWKKAIILLIEKILMNPCPWALATKGLLNTGLWWDIFSWWKLDSWMSFIIFIFIRFSLWNVFFDLFCICYMTDAYLYRDTESPFAWQQQIHFIYPFACVLQHDAACRVIARLKKERDEARGLLAQAERQIPLSSSVAAVANASVVSNGKRGSCSLSLYIF